MKRLKEMDGDRLVMMRTAGLILFILGFMVFHADLVTKGAAAGLLLWYSSVVPALFPFMVLSSMLSASGGTRLLMRPVAALFRFTGISADGWYVLFTGLLCGCPMGAKTCADLLSEKRLRPAEAKFLFAVCSHASPMFLAGFVYPPFASDVPLSFFVCAVYLPVLLLAVLAHAVYMRPQTSGISGFDSGQASAPSAQPVPCSLDDSILNSANLLIKIGGYLIFYSILILAVRQAAFLPPAFRLILSSVLEITTGIRTVQTALVFPYSAVAAAAVFSFGSCSALSQTGAVIRMQGGNRHKKTAGLSIRQYLVWKLTHASLSAAIMAGLIQTL